MLTDARGGPGTDTGGGPAFGGVGVTHHSVLHATQAAICHDASLSGPNLKGKRLSFELLQGLLLGARPHLNNIRQCT